MKRIRISIYTSIFCLPFILSANELDSRNIEIPTDSLELEQSIAKTSALAKEPELLLHYQKGVSSKLAAFLFTWGKSTGGEDDLNKLGFTPDYFSKPSASMYKTSIGFWGGRLKNAVKDYPESYRVMEWYYFYSIISTLLVTAGSVTGLLTIGGIATENYYFSKKGSHYDHTRYGTSITISLYLAWFIPKLINKGKIQKAQKLYNNKRP
ncbi:MAG: hypothetical protein HQK83_17810 [Fibrobacteria bacterium]|nr:hypothetical protein [Fibrobacteria bacterium]